MNNWDFYRSCGPHSSILQLSKRVCLLRQENHQRPPAEEMLFMISIIEEYNISPSTLALLPARKIDYDTIVMKEDKITLHVRQTAFNLIKSAIPTFDWTTYEGRRDGVIQHTGFKHKTPIPVSISKSLYFFPTHSPSKADNIWIAFHHISRIGKVPQQQATKQAQSIVYFKNGQELILNVSFHTLKVQYNRTLQCMLGIEGGGIEALKKIYPW